MWIAYDLPGSYEELPPNLLDELKRDRRWCQGNLMNFRLFLVRGMHPVHRAVFLTGVMSYLSAPLWFMFLALSTALQVVHALTEPQYFLQPRQLFPVWPQWRPELAIALFASTMVLLFLPKLLSIILVWCKGPKEYGGFIRVTLSLLLEVLFSVLLAPVRMLFHTVFVVSAFLGWEVVWNSPQRDDDSTPWGSLYAPRLAAAAGAGVGGRDGMAGSTLPVLASADRRLADPLAVRIGDFQPGDSGPAHQALEAVPDPGRVFAAAGAQGYRCVPDDEPSAFAGRWLYARGV